jgi:2-isopropylmalate synthase
VGKSAFAHKGGIHVAAVAKDPKCYEHVDPASVGNVRHIVMSDQAGRSNLVARMAEIGVDLEHVKKDGLIRVVEQMQVTFAPQVTD